MEEAIAKALIEQMRNYGGFNGIDENGWKVLFDSLIRTPTHPEAGIQPVVRPINHDSEERVVVKGYSLGPDQTLLLTSLFSNEHAGYHSFNFVERVVLQLLKEVLPDDFKQQSKVLGNHNLVDAMHNQAQTYPYSVLGERVTPDLRYRGREIVTPVFFVPGSQQGLHRALMNFERNNPYTRNRR